MATSPVLVSLSEAERSLLVEALDAYEYWQLGDVLPRNDGVVIIPGDLSPGSDPYWDDQQISAEQHVSIEEVRACRALGARLREATRAAAAG